MAKNFHNVQNMKKCLAYGSKQGLGAFAKRQPRIARQDKQDKESKTDGRS